MNYRQRLTITYGLTLLLVGALVSFLVGLQATENSKAAATGYLRDINLQFATLLDLRMWARRNEMRTLAVTPVFGDRQRENEARRLLEQTQDFLPMFTWMGFLDPEGTVDIATGQILEGESIAQRPVFQEGRQGEFIGDVHDAVLLASQFPRLPNGEPIQFVDIAIPVVTDNGEFQGVLAAHLSWEWAQDTRVSLMAPLAGDNQKELFVVSADGNKLLGPEEIVDGSSMAFLPLADIESGESREVTLQWPDGIYYLTDIRRTDGYQDYPGLGWFTVARQPEAIALAPAQQLIHNIWIYSLTIGGISMVGIWYLSGWISRPLRRLSSISQALQLRLNSESTTPASAHVKDEIETVKQAIYRLHEEGKQEYAARQLAEKVSRADPLTGLANREGLRLLLAEYQRVLPRKQVLAVLALDLDGFKQVNDHYGHSAGDELLKAVAYRLQAELRPNQAGVRLGGDEFLLLLPLSVSEGEHIAEIVAYRILEAIAQPFHLGNCTANIGTSIGLAFWPTDDEKLEMVLDLADQALYKAKNTGKRRLVRWQSP